MNNILVISWAFPPLVYPRSIQVSRLLAAMSDLNWHSDVVCVDPASLRPESLILDETLNRPAKGLVKKYHVASLEDWILVRGMIRLFPALGILPDSKWVWKNAAIRKSTSLTSSNKYKAIISFAQPWTDHLIGLQLKEITHLPWIAHFSDPWADSPYVKSSNWVMNKRLEMETVVIKNADSVIFVSEQTADLVMKKYPEEWRNKVSVIPHGYEQLQTEGTSSLKKPDEPLEIVYTGGFYGHRSPEPLLLAAANLQKNADYRNSFQIRFIGETPLLYQQTAIRLGMENCVFEGATTHSKSQEACRNADVLLVIDAPSESGSVFLPSKLVDYLAYHKPIIGITPASGASADLIRRLGFPVFDPENIIGIEAQIRLLVDANKSGDLKLPINFSEIASQYRIENAAARLNNILETVSTD
jgi:hypothetical protein